MPFIFLDLETTGLEAGTDQITEAAWILEDGTERQMFVKHDRLPNEWVLNSTDYLTRIATAPKVTLPEMLRVLKDDCVVRYDEEKNLRYRETFIVGACIAFDDRFIRAAHNLCEWGEPSYHYHVIDVEAMAFGALGLPNMPPLKELRERLGIPGENEAAHTALADAREVKLIFDALRART